MTPALADLGARAAALESWCDAVQQRFDRLRERADAVSEATAEDVYQGVLRKLAELEEEQIAFNEEAASLRAALAEYAAEKAKAEGTEA